MEGADALIVVSGTQGDEGTIQALSTSAALLFTIVAQPAEPFSAATDGSYPDIPF